MEAGELMGREAESNGAYVTLGPTTNIQQSPLGGQGFKSISGDPTLAGLAAAFLIKGMQNNGISACIKHFVCNDQEHEQGLYSVIVTDRALREIYLKPFKIAA